MPENAANNSFVRIQIENALWLLLKEKSLADISVSEIVRKANVSRISFYRNSDCKEDILRSDLNHITEDFMRVSGIRYKDAELCVYFETLFQHMKKHEKKCTILYKRGLIGLIKEQFDHSFVSTYKDIYGEFKASFLAGGIYNIFLLWLEHDSRESPKELADQLKAVLEK